MKNEKNISYRPQNTKKCLYCESPIEDYIVINKRENTETLVKRSPSVENDKVCEWCILDREKIKLSSACVSCNAPIFPSIDIYHRNGNYCVRCCADATDRASKNKGETTLMSLFSNIK